MNNKIETDKSQWTWTERMGIVAACASALFVFKNDLLRFVTNTRETIRGEIRENMPLSYEIDRARELAAALVPDLRRNHEVIIREQVEIDDLRKDIKQSRSRLNRLREQIVAIRAQLSASPASQSDASSQLSTSEIRRELEHRFATFQSELATVESKADTLKYREESLAKAQAAQGEIRRKKRELEAQVAQLEARVKLMEREGVDSHIVVDRDNLARCEDQLRYLKKRLSIAEGLSKFSDQEMPDVPANERDFTDTQIENEIDQFLEHHKS